MAGYPSIGNRHKISWIFRFHFKQIQIIPFQNSKEKKSKEKKANDDKKKRKELTDDGEVDAAVTRRRFLEVDTASVEAGVHFADVIDA